MGATSTVSEPDTTNTPAADPARVTIRTLTPGSNPYLDEWADTVRPLTTNSPVSLDEYTEILATRDRLVREYAWAIPNEQAIAAIEDCGPIVEIGAGGGYWAALIHAAGCDIVTYDTAPPEAGSNRWADTIWYRSSVGGPEKAADHPDRVLLLIWPPYNTPMAADTLDAYTGDTVIYVGDRDGGCTADDRFHQLLEHRYSNIGCVTLPTWPARCDDLTIWQRH
jgi:hypothetical protein